MSDLKETLKSLMAGLFKCDVSELDGAIRDELAAGRPVREIAASLARKSGLSRREVYARAVALREAGS